MSKTSIPEKIKTQLWTLSAGRCEYRGCNKPLWKDELSMANMNNAYIAHIVADSQDGPRGDKVRSPLLAKSFNNLMLMCDAHHRLIDKEDVDGHPENLLVEMKKEHEKRIELLTSLSSSKKTHIILYGANIGNQGSPLNFESSFQAIIPDKFPTESYGIELGITNSFIEDKEDLFWELESQNLERQFKEKVENLKIHSPIKSFSAFGLAPQPLLIKFGTLFNDLYDVQVFQRHREPATWEWQDETDFDEFILIEPKEFDGLPVLNISLSATITNDRIEKLFDSKICIWTITHIKPDNDFLKSKTILSKFRKTCRHFFDIAKAKHEQDNKLHVFPAMPVSAAIEFGRIWMPKADMNLIIYDQNKERNGFYKTIEI
ncbi:SAVED domain-containing protein [uncultured Draconibacterium sp.]|uniref:SAVED domain-containing protein n=1 Tax=uncultured Draconibacterium sp. TaxID=1573823 RepID=UPI003216A333